MRNRFKYTTIAHKGRSFLGPYDEHVIRHLLNRFEGFVLDIGCGKGAVMGALGCRGIGIEHNPAFAAEAMRRNPDSEIWQDDAAVCLRNKRLPERIDLIVCLGASQALGTPREAMEKLSELLPRGSQLMWGEGYWRKKPDPEYLAFLDAKESDMGSFSELRYAGERLGLEHVVGRESTVQDWDEYEDSYHRSVLDWCHEHPDDIDCEMFGSRITAWRDAYLKWGRDTLGFGIHLFYKA